MSAGAVSIMVTSSVGGEGFALDEDVFEQLPTVPSTESIPRSTGLPHAAMLSLEDADQFLRWREASIVAIVGERNGGKTTLVTEMYGRFLKGPFADVSFCHSLSLLGFERKCFQSRADSGARYPDTPRTSAQDGLSFFHLALAKEDGLDRRDLLISERAGEVYREVRDMPSRASDLVEINKANTIAFIVDGERVADSRMRTEVFASVRTMLRALVFRSNINTQAQIQLVTTKYDLLEGERMVDARDSLSEFEKNIAELIGTKFDFVTFRTAARQPNLEEGSVGRDLDLLLKSWLRPKAVLRMESIKLPNLSDEFDRLMLKRVVK